MTPQPAPGPAERFVIQRELGAGSTGKVFHAVDLARGEAVAIKRLRRPTPEAVQRFKREFRALADVTHRNLVQLHELVGDGGDWLIVMELVAGTSFLGYIREPIAGDDIATISDAESAVTAPISRGGDGRRAISQPSAPTCILGDAELDRLRGALLQLVDGISALHQAGHLHRDIKPSNVLVESGGRVVILDFSLVAELAGSGPSASVEGTPGYMAPEQLAGDALTEACDWYAVGVMLYEAITGVRPFRGSVRAIADAQRRYRARSLADIPGVPARLAELVDRLLDRNPARRATGADIRRALGATTPAPLTSQPILIGRDSELDLLEEVVDRARRGFPGIALVTGESGAGKTALAGELVSRCREQGDVVLLRGRCYQRESVPYKAFDAVIDMLANWLLAQPSSELAEPLPDSGGEIARLFPVFHRLDLTSSLAAQVTGDVEPREARRRGLSALRGLLARIARRHPLVIVIDDLHWADGDSCRLLEELVRAPMPWLALCLFTRQAGATAARCAEILAAADPLAERIELELLGLAPRAALALARALCGQLLPGDDTGDLARQVATDSGGHPLFIYELIRRAARDPSHQPLTLEQLLADRLATLSPGARRLLTVVSVAGRPIPQSIASWAAGGHRDADADLMLLREHHLVRARPGAAEPTVECYHDRIREVIAASLDSDVERELHLRLARALEVSGEADLEAVGDHFAAGGDRLRAVALYERAARRASELLAFDRAARLYQLAISAGNAGSDLALRTARADALAAAGRGPEAADDYLIVARESDGGARLEAERKAAEQLLMSGHVDEGLAVARSMLGRIGLRLPRSRRSAVIRLAWRRLQLRRRGLALPAEPRAPTPAERDRLAVFRALSHGMGVIDPIIANEFQARYLLTALETGDPDRVGPALAVEACFRASLGRRHQQIAGGMLDWLDDWAAASSLADAPGWAATARGFVAYFDSRFPAAADSFASAADSFACASRGTAWELATVRLFRLWALLHSGRLPEVRDVYRDYLRDARARGDRYFAVTLIRSCSLALLLHSDRELLCTDLERARWSETDRGYHVQHWFDAKARGDLALANRQPIDAGAWVRAQRAGLRRSLLGKLPFIRAECAWTGGRLALLDPTAPLSLARSCLRRLRRSGAGYAAVWAAILEAGIARRAGHVDQAAEALARAIDEAGWRSMALCAEVARHELGRLTNRPSSVRDAASWMTRMGIADPARACALLLPDLERGDR